MAVDRFAGGLHAIGDDDVAAGPAEYFKESGFAADVADLRVDDLPARKIDAPALFPTLDPHGTGCHDAAFHLNQVGERGAAGDSGEGGRFVGWSGLHRVARTPSFWDFARGAL